MKSFSIVPVLLSIVVLLSSCEAIGGLLKASLYVGILIGLGIAFIIFWVWRKIKR
jgi:hypothetical protein